MRLSLIFVILVSVSVVRDQISSSSARGAGSAVLGADLDAYLRPVRGEPHLQRRSARREGRSDPFASGLGHG
jgi:hypothetical protein